MTERILATGATGNIGSMLVPRLAQHGASVRAFVRDRDKAASLAQAGAELAVGTYEQRDTLQSAMEGTDTLVLITAPNPAAHEQAAAALEVARETGVRRLVRVSVIKADPNGPTENVRQHADTEERIQNSGIPYTILRPHFFMQNLFVSLDTLNEEGRLYWGMGDGKLGMVDVRDIVDVAYEVTTNPGDHENQTYALTGPESITFHEVAEALGEATGRPVEYVPVPPDAVKDALMQMGMSEWFGGLMKDYCKAYSENWGDFVTDDVAKIAGHPARSIVDFAREVFAGALR